MDQQAIQQQALANARNGESMSNYPAIIQGFMEKGLAAADIQPRENVFTFHAWKALGRQVRKGEHGVKVCTYVPMTKQQEDGTEEAFRAPRMTTVFHVSQTDPIAGMAQATARAIAGEQSRETARSIHAQAAELQKQTARAASTAQAGYYSDEFTPIA